MRRLLTIRVMAQDTFGSRPAKAHVTRPALDRGLHIGAEARPYGSVQPDEQDAADDEGQFWSP